MVPRQLGVLHVEQHSDIVGWLYTYKAVHGQVRLSTDGTVFLDAETEVQPDACLWQPGPGGPRLTENHYLEGAPQFVVEVAASSANYDLHEKKEAYRRNGVREYVVWRVIDRAIDWFELRDGAYVLREPDEAGERPGREGLSRRWVGHGHTLAGDNPGPDGQDRCPDDARSPP